MISAKHLTKCYGDFIAVDDLSFEIEEGHVYGFLGPNGAGKSTTMNIMTGCLSPSDGTVTIGGYDIFDQPEQAKRLIGYLPEIPPLYVNETPEEYLTFVAEAKGVKGKDVKAQVQNVMRLTGIENMRSRLISDLSKGYRQRVGIAQALLGDPKVIILDEPTVGLDPIQIIEIRDLIKKLGEDHTVIFSSHILSEVQAICEKVLIISRGKLVAFDEPAMLEQLLRPSNTVTLTAEVAAEELTDILKDICSEYTVDEHTDGTVTVTLSIGDGEPRDICRSVFFAFAEHGNAILNMEAAKASLEDIFIELTENAEETESSDEQAVASVEAFENSSDENTDTEEADSR